MLPLFVCMLLVKQCTIVATTLNVEWQHQLTDVALAGKQETDLKINSETDAATPVTAAVTDDFEQILETKLNETRYGAEITEQQKILSRKRRYLIFPEGTSFQVVYDLIIGVVDYTNYLILGVTVALAWELPSKPPSEIIEDIQSQLNDGSLDLSRNDTISNITYVDTSSITTTNKTGSSSYMPNYINFSDSPQAVRPYYSIPPVFRPPMHQKYNMQRIPDSYYRPIAPPPAGWRRKDHNYYYRKPVSSAKNPFYSWIKNPQSAQSSAAAYPWWEMASRLSNAIRPKQKDYYYKRLPYKQPNQRTPYGYHQIPPHSARPEQPIRHHRIYPVFGKRSIPDSANPHAAHKRHRRSGELATEMALSKLDRIHIRHHRNSRQQLYDKIEKYLDKNKLHGQHCVLRALCETGQKSHEREPGTFVAELMRVVFTLPEALDNELVAYRDTRYDHANAHKGDCAQTYHLCKHSMWDAHFIK